MNKLENILYPQIEKVLEALKQHLIRTDSLERIAEETGLNLNQIHLLFAEWADASPQKFMQYISNETVKKVLKSDRQISLFDSEDETKNNLVNNRLPISFVRIIRMTAEEYNNNGKNLTIQYGFGESHFGKLIVASTQKGICYIAFYEMAELAVALLKSKFPNADFEHYLNTVHENALAIFQKNCQHLPEIKLHLKGTDFQLTVWQSLLNIPMGELTTYGALAQKIDKPKASRAIGTAIGKNPIAFLIPCHRVVQSTGHLGGYMWGSTRKTAIIGWELTNANKL